MGDSTRVEQRALLKQVSDAAYDVWSKAVDIKLEGLTPDNFRELENRFNRLKRGFEELNEQCK